MLNVCLYPISFECNPLQITVGQNRFRKIFCASNVKTLQFTPPLSLQGFFLNSFKMVTKQLYKVYILNYNFWVRRIIHCSKISKKIYQCINLFLSNVGVLLLCISEKNDHNAFFMLSWLKKLGYKCIFRDNTTSPNFISIRWKTKTFLLIAIFFSCSDSK